jgi:HEAT repeat protein
MNYDDLNNELKHAGVPEWEFMGQRGDPIDTLVNTKTSSHPYLEILIKYLPHLKGMELQMVVRSLTEKRNKKASIPLLSIFKDRNELNEHTLWAVGNALYTIDDKRTYSDIIEICKDKSLGMARARLMGILSRIRTEETFQILLDNLEDQSVKGNVIEALGRFGDSRAISLLEKTKVDKTKYEFKAKKTALKDFIEKKTVANN